MARENALSVMQTYSVNRMPKSRPESDTSSRMEPLNGCPSSIIISPECSAANKAFSSHATR
jgi:hypothetical protein